MRTFPALVITTRQQIIAIAGIWAAVVAGCGQQPQPPNVSTRGQNGAQTNQRAAELVRWLTNLDKAKEIAAAEGKDLFINFTGLSWCGACMELEHDVLTRPEFAPAAEQFVLVRLDYGPGDNLLPQNRLPQEPPESQVSWREFYGINSFPTLILADAGGRPYALTGNNGLRPSPYLEHIQELRGAHAKRDDAFAKAAAAEGAEKARHLAEGLGALRSALHVIGSNVDLLVRFYATEIDTLIRLDPDSSAGLKPKFEETLRAEQQRSDVHAFYVRLDVVYKEQGINAALELLDERITTAESTDLRNRFRQSRLTYLEWSGRHEEALALSRELAVDASFSEDERHGTRKRIAYNLCRLDRPDEALALYDVMLVEAKNNPRRQFSLLWDKAEMVLWQQKRFADVLAAWEQAIPLVEPNTENWRDAQWWRVRTLARMGLADDAWQAYEAVASAGQLRPVEQASWMVWIAMMLNEHGSRDAALNATAKAEQALAVVPIESKQDREGADRVGKMLAKLKSEPTKANGDTKTTVEPSKAGQ